LKRETREKLAKLERKTQEAIHILIRASHAQPLVQQFLITFAGQRLAAQKGQSDDLVGAMRAEEQQHQDLSDEED